MEDTTKSIILSGHIEAMERVIAEINERLKDAKEGLDTGRVNAVLGGLSGTIDLTDALRALLLACYSIDGRYFNLR